MLADELVHALCESVELVQDRPRGGKGKGGKGSKGGMKGAGKGGKGGRGRGGIGRGRDIGF